MRVLLFSLVVLCGISGCSVSEPGLPSTALLSPPQGMQIARSVIHIHSPFSHDACDGEGVIDGVVNEQCLNDLRQAMCDNNIDFAGLTDHPNFMADYDIETLIHHREGDSLIEKDGQVIANKIHCGQHDVLMMTGFEDELMTVGLERHIDSDPLIRQEVYNDGSVQTKNQLEQQTDAVVVVPHTEQRSDDYLLALQPSVIEIGNIHALSLPSIARNYLDRNYANVVFEVLVFLTQQVGATDLDLVMIPLLGFDDVYLRKWNTLLAAGQSVAGFFGSDVHQNILSKELLDGELLDSYRRFTGAMTNHLLVAEKTPQAIKQALANGHGWVVFEALGSPVGMDFSAELAGDALIVGEHGLWEEGYQLKIPNITVFGVSSFDDQPRVISRLVRILENGESEVVASAENTALAYEPSGAGIYRAEISIQPTHLSHHFNLDKGGVKYIVEAERKWIVSNVIYLD